LEELALFPDHADKGQAIPPGKAGRGPSTHMEATVGIHDASDGMMKAKERTVIGMGSELVEEFTRVDDGRVSFFINLIQNMI
jgi:hypothetical protein